MLNFHHVQRYLLATNPRIITHARSGLATLKLLKAANMVALEGHKPLWSTSPYCVSNPRRWNTDISL